MLSLSLDVRLLAPLGCTEDELVNGLCAKLRTLAADPERVRTEMQGAFCAAGFSSEALQCLQGDVLGRSEAGSVRAEDSSSISAPAEGAAGVLFSGPSAEGKPEAAESQPSAPLVNLVTWLLSLPGLTHQEIAEACGKGVSINTVAAIAATSEQATRGARLKRAIDRLMRLAKEGKLTALHIALLLDAHKLLTGGAQPEGKDHE